MICKGAIEEMLKVSSFAFDPGEDKQLQIFSDAIIPLNESARKLILQETQKMNEDGMRVLLLAVREFEPRELNYSVSDESDLVIAGLIGFLDPAKPSASEALKRLQALGVTVKVLTGDNEIVTKKICKTWYSVWQHKLGSELDSMSD